MSFVGEIALWLVALSACPLDNGDLSSHASSWFYAAQHPQLLSDGLTSNDDGLGRGWLTQAEDAQYELCFYSPRLRSHELTGATSINAFVHPDRRGESSKVHLPTSLIMDGITRTPIGLLACLGEIPTTFP